MHRHRAGTGFCAEHAAIAAMITDLDAVMSDPMKREGVFYAARLMEQDRTIMGFSPHTLGVAIC